MAIMANIKMYYTKKINFSIDMYNINKMYVSNILITIKRVIAFYKDQMVN